MAAMQQQRSTAAHRRRLEGLHAHLAPQPSAGWLASLLGQGSGGGTPHDVLETLHEAGDLRDRLVLRDIMQGPQEVSLNYRRHVVRDVVYMMDITEE